MALADRAFKNQSVRWRVLILGQDISNMLSHSDIGSIRFQLDNVFLTEFQSGDCQLVLSDPDGIFSTAKSSNFFTANEWARTGYLADVEIYGGYEDPTGLEETLVFHGEILNVQQNSKTRLVEITVTDSADIHREEVNNFGIPKEFSLRHTGQTSIRGSYEFDSRLSPVSDDSVGATLHGENSLGTVVNLSMIEKDVLDDYGDLKETNFNVVEGNAGSVLQTEKEVTSLSDVRVSAKFKSPYRYRPVTEIVNDIAIFYNLRLSELSLLEPQIADRHFSTLGRVGYAISEGTRRAEEEFSWEGDVTDFIIDTSTRFFYFLVSESSNPVHRSTVKPRLFEYDALRDEYRVLVQAAAHEEWWGLTTPDFETFYILKTTGIFEGDLPRLATYNPSEYNTAAQPQTSVLLYNKTTNNLREVLNTGTSQRPQIAAYYHYGFYAGNTTNYRTNERFGFLPDTRHNFTWNRGVLWYRFARRSGFGLARFNESTNTIVEEISIPRDGRNNEASFDFIIDETDSKIYGAHTVQTQTRSQFLLYEKALASSY